MGYIVSIVVLVIVVWFFRLSLFSFLIFFKVRLEGRKPSLQLISSLREDFVHEGKKKFAGLGQILESLEEGEKIQSHLDYFKKLLSQLRSLLETQKKNFLLVSDDIFIYGKIKSRLIKIQKRSEIFKKSDKERSSNIKKTRVDLKKVQDEIEAILNKATERFSFEIAEAVKEAVKTVRMEKSDILQRKDIRIEESYPKDVRRMGLPYYALRDWHKLLANLLRNAIESIEFRVESEEKKDIEDEIKRNWIKVRVEQDDSDYVLITIEDSGIGMDKQTRNEFFKRGFTKKDTGLGLGITEDSVDLVNRYGSWEIESDVGKGTKIKIRIEKDKVQKQRIEIEGKRTILQKAFPTPTRVVLTFLLFVIVGLTILFSVDKYSRFWEDWNPAFVRLQDENTVVVEAEDGRFLWSQKFTQKIRERSITIGDINGDRINEVLIGTKSGLKETGYLFCFSFKREELWKFALGAEDIFQVPSNRYSCDKIIVRDLNLDGESQMLVGAENNPWFPYQIALLDGKGQLQTSYWHSGSVSLLLCDDVDDDGIPEVVFGGVNNRLRYSAVLGILDHSKIWGQSPPYRDTVLTKAKEKIYVKFPFIRGLGGENDRYSSVVAFIYAGRENGSDIYHVTVRDLPGFEFEREYHLDKELTHIKQLIIHPDSRFLWEKLKSEGMIDYDLSAEIVESWKEIEVWKNGVKVK